MSTFNIAFLITHQLHEKRKNNENFLNKNLLSSAKVFSLDQDLRSELVESNRKINSINEVFLFVLSLLFISIYIYIYIYVCVCVCVYVCVCVCVCVSIYGTHRTANKSTTVNDVLFFVSDLKIVYYDNY